MTDLERYLRTERLPYRATVAVGGIKPDSACDLGHGFQLIPWKDVPNSNVKRAIDEASPFHRSFYHPDAGLLRELEMQRIHVEDLVGYLLENEAGFEVLSLPSVAQSTTTSSESARPWSRRSRSLCSTRRSGRRTRGHPDGCDRAKGLHSARTGSWLAGGRASRSDSRRALMKSRGWW